MNETQVTVSKDVTEIIPFGSDQAIKLSVEIVKNLIAVPTRSGALPSKNDCLKFIALCRAKHLNPFEGDAFMLGYDTQNGAQFSQITAHQVFLKRAEANPHFDGMESGVIIDREGSEEPIEREGDYFDNNAETLLGGWARVHRKDRRIPIYRRLKFSTFDTGQSRWKKDPAGMIVKCAEADALRSAFPTHLGGLYMADERVLKADIEVVPDPLVLQARNEAPFRTEAQLVEEAQFKAKVENEKQSPQRELEGFITEAKFSFEEFRKWCIANGIADADSLASFDEVKEADAIRLLRAKTGLLKQLTAVREAK